MMGTDTSDPGDEEGGEFADAPVSRREFVRISAATAGALALPGTTSADLDASHLTERHRFVVEHTEDDYEVPTLVYSTKGALEELVDTDGIERTTTEPEPAAYGRLTAPQVEAVDDVEGVERLEYAPGANPWWRLGGYEAGVFPEPTESVDYIGFEEHVRGMEHLADEHADRLRFRSIGRSPGHRNRFSGEDEPQELYVAELTEDVEDREAFAEKETIAFVASIHGDERTGVEAASRTIERTLTGEEETIEALLDEVAIVVLYANPDGWRVRDPIYRSERHNFQRETATGVDPNRQYPTAGWTDPNYNPAEPNGANLVDDRPDAVDDDVPPSIAETVPDSLAIAHHLRGYENLEHVVDLHGMHWSDEFVLGLIANAQYDHADLHAIDAMNEAIGEAIEDELGPLEDRLGAIEPATERYEVVREEGSAELPEPEEMLPERWYDQGTIYDTIDYSTTGALLGWAAHPEEFGGLGARAIALEMSFANTLSPMEKYYIPELMDVQAGAYSASIRAVVEHAASETDAWIETGERSTAVVRSDELTRSSADLEFAETRDDRIRRTTTVGAEGATETIEVGEDAWELSITATPLDDVALEATLIDPGGEEVRSFRPGVEERDGPDWTIGRPEPGSWRLELSNRREGAGEVRLDVDTLLSDGLPDPREVLGYEQREYESSPFEYFEAYADHAARTEDGRGSPAPIDDLTPGEVRDGALLRGEGVPAYENVVVIHDAADDDAYVDALSAFADAGGTVVLTDDGVSLLESLDDELAGSVERRRRAFAALEDKEDHPLLEGTRPIQRELWTLSPVGYAIDEEAPITVVDEGAFADAGGTVAARVEVDSGEEQSDGGEDKPAGVAVGSLAHGDGEVHVVGSLLPPANQTHLHPFGMLDHSTTLLGHTVLSNALGHDQHRSVDGRREPMRTIADD